MRSGAISKCVLCVCSETLLDDFMLTHPIFLTADRFQQVLLQQYPSLSMLSACRLSCGRKLILALSLCSVQCLEEQKRRGWIYDTMGVEPEQEVTSSSPVTVSR